MRLCGDLNIPCDWINPEVSQNHRKNFNKSTSIYELSVKPYNKSWEFEVPPPKATPPGNKALLRDYWPLVSDKALLGAYFLGGVVGVGVP